MTLTLADANRVIAGAIEKANQIVLWPRRRADLPPRCPDRCRGVGGGTAQEDEDCARAGVEKLWGPPTTTRARVILISQTQAAAPDLR